MDRVKIVRVMQALYEEAEENLTRRQEALDNPKNRPELEKRLAELAEARVVIEEMGGAPLYAADDVDLQLVRRIRGELFGDDSRKLSNWEAAMLIKKSRKQKTVPFRLLDIIAYSYDTTLTYAQGAVKRREIAERFGFEVED